MAKIAFLTGGTNETTLDGISRAVTRNFTSPGCIGDNDLKVTENGTPDNKVLISTGSALIGFNSPDGTQEDKYYHLFADVAETVTITANTSGNPRIDAIVSYPDVSGGAPTDNDGAGKFVAVAGTPAATPSAPTDANIVTALGAGVPYTVHAHVAVANGFTSITNANITDMRVFADTNDRVIGDTTSDFVASGLIWAASAGLVGAMTSGRAYIGGKHINKSALTHTFAASKDTYVDLPSTAKHSNYDDLTYTAVANGAASPALAAGSIRLAKVVTSGAAVTSVTTSGFDSLGNAISKVSPVQSIIGYANVTATQAGITTLTDVTGLSDTVLVPSGRAVKIMALVHPISSATGNNIQIAVLDGSTQLQLSTFTNVTQTSQPETVVIEWVGYPTAGSHTYKIQAGFLGGYSGTLSISASTTVPSQMSIELV